MNDYIKWDGKGKGSALGNRIFIKTISSAGILPAYALLSLVAWRYAMLDKKGVRAIRAFRKNAGLKNTNIWHIYKHYYSFGMSLIDRIAFSTVKKPPFTYTVINEKFIADILERKRGVILVSAHIGTWEIAGNLLSDRLDADTYAVLLDNEKQELKNVYRQMTGKRRFHTITIKEDPVAMMVSIKEALHNNGIICFLADRVIGPSKVKLPFLGKDADFPRGPFQIAAITGTPIVPYVTVKDGLNHFTFKAYPPILFENLTKQNRDEHILCTMKQYVSIIEEIAKNYPCQWFNFFDFWEEGENFGKKL